MVDEVQRAADSVQDDVYYTPDQIDYWLKHWRELQEKAVRTPGSTSDFLPDPRTRGRGFKPTNTQHYTDIMADIELAWIHMRRWSAEFTAIERRMQGLSLRAIADAMSMPRETLRRRYWDAVEAMAIELGWNDEDGLDSGSEKV